MLPPSETEKSLIISDILGSSSAPASFESYLRHYNHVICVPSTASAVVEVDKPALRTHDEVIEALKKLRATPGLTRAAFESVAFAQDGVLQAELERASGAVVWASFMLNADTYKSRYKPTSSAEKEGIELRWGRNQGFGEFIQQFVDRESERTRENEPQEIRPHKTIKAWKLRKRHNIEIIGTDNIFEHLELNVTVKRLKVFHNVGFLRAHLERSRDSHLALSAEESIRLGTLPPQLALETLASIHLVLFPVNTDDKRTRSLVRKLIDRRTFDADIAWVAWVRDIPPQGTFSIWGDRLAQLHKLVKKPPPRNSVIAWFERHTSERNALTVAVIGLLLSVLFGFLSFVTGLLQLILAWYAYRYPMETSSTLPATGG